jgi:hypothetical protein
MLLPLLGIDQELNRNDFDISCGITNYCKQGFIKICSIKLDFISKSAFSMYKFLHCVYAKFVYCVFSKFVYCVYAKFVYFVYAKFVCCVCAKFVYCVFAKFMYCVYAKFVYCILDFKL